MAKLDRALFGQYATGTLARALAFRQTANPPDPPGEDPVTWGTVCKIPSTSCAPTVLQLAHRAVFLDMVAEWRSLSAADRAAWGANCPANLTGFNFFLRLRLSAAFFYLGFCVFGETVFQTAYLTSEPAAADYDAIFPAGLDSLPTLQDGSGAPQGWFFNRAADALLSIEGYLLPLMARIEA